MLGVASDADEAAIRAAYKALARRWHPDRNPGSKEAEEQIKQINEAYAVLRDPLRRRMHDLLLAQGADVRGAARPSERMQRDFPGQGAGRGEYAFDPEGRLRAAWGPTRIRLFPWEMWLIRWLLISSTWFFTRFGMQLLRPELWLALLVAAGVGFLYFWPVSLIFMLLMMVLTVAVPGALLFYIYLRIKFSRH